MSVFNHTDVAANGAQMLHTDVTTPDGQLDAAVGNLTTLTTTAKTSVVAALLEMLAAGWVTATRLATDAVTSVKIQAGAVTTAKLAASAVTANELASDAVTTAKILDANVTAAKLAAAVAGNGLAGGAGTALSVNVDGTTLEINADTLRVKAQGLTGDLLDRSGFAPPNVFVDATFQTVPLKITAEWGIGGHTFRWFPRTQALLDEVAELIFNDTANPMGIGQRTLRLKGSSSGVNLGWYISLAEAGWKAGDTISGSAYVLAAGGSYTLNIRCYGPSGTALGSIQLGLAHTMSGAPWQLLNQGAVIDAGAAYVLFFVTRNSLSNDCDIYWRHGGPGLLIPTVPSNQGYLPQMGIPRKRASDARYLVPDYMAQVSKILLADGTSQVDVAYIADSWGQRAVITPALRTWLQTTYGDGGLGFVSFYITFGLGSSTYWEGLSGGANTVRAGTWTDSARAVGSRGPDITHVATTDAAATMKLTTTVTFTAVDILAYTSTNGGTYDYRIDAGSWVPVVTAGAAGVDVEAVTGLGNTTHVIEFRVNTIGTDGLTFLGLNLKKSGNGARLHRLAIQSATAAHWSQVDAATWQAGIAAIAPNLAIISLGTNDKTANTTPQLYGAQMATIAQRVRAARALTDILLFSPCDVLDSGGTTYTVAQYASALRTIASSLDYAYFDGYAVMPTNADAIARALMEPAAPDSRHPYPVGGKLLADVMISDFLNLV